MRHHFFALGFLILSACSATTEKYFDGASIPSGLIEAPYTTDNKELKDEIQLILKLQKNFNLNELELASREKYLRPEIFILYANRSLTRELYPNLHQLLDRVSATTKSVNDSMKYTWNAPRPYQVDKRINMLITPSPGPGYPSGHASGSLVSAQVLGLLIPQKNQDLIKLAKKIAARRVLVGMHFPHDIIVGEQVARLVLGGLMQNNDFLNDLKAARQELEANPPKNLTAPVAPAPAIKEAAPLAAPSVASDNQALPAQ